jgi:two-component system response regulator PilR (NtrC family)
VLVTGESGTGKEWVARAIHFYSLRRDRPFIALNCGALPETLLESELFGYMKGAFTGAGTNKKGLIESAEKGTLFLDEIGEMTPMMQVKLLRVLQERKFRRLGGVEEMEAAMRVIAATNQDLTKMIAEGKFREDLFYRINVIPIHLPPLRERGEDIRLLADYFLGKYRDQMGRGIHSVSQDAMDLLEAYDWPGNIRELENVVERAVALEKSHSILPESLPEHIVKRLPKGPAAAGLLPESGFNLEKHVEGLEKEYITQALQRARGVQVKAAELLGIPYRSFRYYAKKYNLK